MRNKDIYSDIREQTCRQDGYEYTYTLMCARDGELTRYLLRVSLVSPDGERTAATIAEPVCDGGRALLLFRLLVRELVTPIDLPYVMDDMLDL